MKARPYLKQLRKLIAENPMSTAEELANIAGWDLKKTQEQISYLVSGGHVNSLPKRYVMAEPQNAKYLRDKERLRKLREKKDSEKRAKEKIEKSAHHIVSTAINNRSELARAWG